MRYLRTATAFLVHFLLLSPCLSPALATALDSGLDYLAASQRPDGHWGGGASLTEPYVNTAAVVQSLADIGATAGEMYASGRSWLDDATPMTAAETALRICLNRTA